MSQFEFRKIDLNSTPPKVSDIDLLNEAGRDGWRVIFVGPNLVAYLEREVSVPAKVRVRAKGAVAAE